MNRRLYKSRAAFTFIEVLVVVAIIAILSIVVILTLNPPELLKQARDASRISGLATLKGAVNLYIADQAGSASFSLGNSTTTYVSLTDPNATTTAGTDCSDLGSNFLNGGYFQCDASSTYRNVSSTGWIPINFQAIEGGSPFGTLPVDPVNTTSSNMYYTYAVNGILFNLVANPESQKYESQLAANPQLFTVGTANQNVYGGSWVAVPGNSTFGTGNFLVMKYGASCASMVTGNSLTSPVEVNSGAYDDSAQACSVANGYVPSSQPGALPIDKATETRAKQYCASVGAHLLTNDEYMTIVTNAVNQGVNWYGGTVGQNYLYTGHTDNIPVYVSVASANDAQNCSGTDGPSSCGGTGTNNSQVRTYTLSNGSVLWDVVGNLWEQVQRSINNAGDNTNTITPPTCSDHGAQWEWCNFNSHPNVISWNDPTFNATTIAPPNGSWGTSQGMGQIYTFGNGVNQNTQSIVRGGDWYGGNVVGPFAFNVNWNTATTSSIAGFRCAR